MQYDRISSVCTAIMSPVFFHSFVDCSEARGVTTEMVEVGKVNVCHCKGDQVLDIAPLVLDACCVGANSNRRSYKAWLQDCPQDASRP
jgi:hypothetical protein